MPLKECCKPVGLCTAHRTGLGFAQRTAPALNGAHVARRRHLNIRGKSANLPAITERDWLDIKFGVDVGVDYYALSFVRNADVIYELKRYLAQQGAPRRHCRLSQLLQGLGF